VLLVNLLAALNFANIFLKIKNVWKMKNVKKRKNVQSIAIACSLGFQLQICDSRSFRQMDRGQTDRRTEWTSYRYIDPAAYYASRVNNLRTAGTLEL